jgi:hypothetical protein
MCACMNVCTVCVCMYCMYVCMFLCMHVCKCMHVVCIFYSLSPSPSIIGVLCMHVGVCVCVSVCCMHTMIATYILMHCVHAHKCCITCVRFGVVYKEHYKHTYAQSKIQTIYTQTPHDIKKMHTHLVCVINP